MNKRVKQTLKLEVVEMTAKITSEDTKLTDENWLDTNDEGLLDLLGELNTSSKLQDDIQVAETLPYENSVSQSHYVVDNLQIQFEDDHYLLATNTNQVVLNNGDTIRCNDTMLKVTIICEHVVLAHQPEDQVPAGELFSENYEIWHKPPANIAIQPMQDDHIADPLFDATPKAVNRSWPEHKDQLGFLTDHTIPAVPATDDRQLPLIQPDHYQNHADIQAEYGGLNISIDDNYSPALSRTDDIDAPSIEEAFPTPAEQGNVMRDLGINENASTITNKVYQNQSQPYGEQSPFDMLDELLLDSGNRAQTMDNAVSTPLQKSDRHSPLADNIKGLFKIFKQKPV